MKDRAVSKSFQLWVIVSIVMAIVMTIFFTLYGELLQLANKNITGSDKLVWYLLICPIWSCILVENKNNNFYLSNVVQGILMGIIFSVLYFIVFVLAIIATKIPTIAVFLISMVIFLPLIPLKKYKHTLFFIYFSFISIYSLLSMAYVNNDFSYGIIWGFINLIVFGLIISLIQEIKIFFFRK